MRPKFTDGDVVKHIPTDHDPRIFSGEVIRVYKTNERMFKGWRADVRLPSGGFGSFFADSFIKIARHGCVTVGENK